MAGLSDGCGGEIEVYLEKRWQKRGNYVSTLKGNSPSVSFFFPTHSVSFIDWRKERGGEKEGKRDEHRNQTITVNV